MANDTLRRLRINSWAGFERHVRDRSPNLLVELPKYPDAVLVAGCQRSGTTAITRILRDAIGMPNLCLTSDDELDAALLLSGIAKSEYSGRHCFQTTYLNDRVGEYFEHHDFRLVWIIRNPQSVVQSMLYNWRYGALVRLFKRCGSRGLDERERKSFDRFGSLPFSRLQMACLSYNAKTAQTQLLAEKLGQDRLFIVDYDELVDRREEILPRIFEFVRLEFDPAELARIKRSSTSLRGKLSKRSVNYVDQVCCAEYKRARRLIERNS
jgi:hypothetical protein